MLKYYDYTFFGTIFGSLEQLAADILVMLFVSPFKFSTIFFLYLMFSLIFMNMPIRLFVYHAIRKVLCLNFLLVASLVV